MLEKVGEPYRWERPPQFGDRVRLNSGGPVMLVVDMKYPRWHSTTCAWPDGEHAFDYRMLRPA